MPDLLTQLSPHLTLAEMTRSEKAVKLNIANIPDADAIDAMRAWASHIYDPTVVHFGGRRVFVSSGFRSAALDTAVNNRLTNSQHKRGEAGDLDNDGVPGGPTNAEIFHFIRLNLPFDQLIWEYGDATGPAWVHCSRKLSGRQRRQVLRCVRDRDGKPTYPVWTP